MDRRQDIIAELPGLRRYARALLKDPAAADDLVQDCLERALRRMGQLKQDAKLRAWMFSILHNLYIDGERRIKRQLDDHALSRDLEGAIVSAPAQDHRLAVRDVVRALGTLSEDQKQVVLLVGLEGMSYNDTAEILAIPVGTVMSRLARGREELAQQMDTGGRPHLRRIK